MAEDLTSGIGPVEENLYGNLHKDVTNEMLLEALIEVRNKNFAVLVTTIIGLAAETHPEELRTAIGKVFDLSKWERHATSVSAVYSRLNQEAVSTQDRLYDTNKKLDEFNKELDSARV